MIGATSGITAQAVASGTSDPVQFGDLDVGITPGFFSINQDLGDTATVEVPSGSLPEVITLSGLTLSIDLSDANNATSITDFVVSGDATLTLAAAASISPAQAGPASYDVTSVSFSAELTGNELSDVNPILTGGGINTVVATVSVTATSVPDLPPGSEIILTLGTATGVVGP